MRKSSKSFIFLFIAIFLVLSLPFAASERLRGMISSIFSPIWELLSPLQIHGKQVEKATYVDIQKNSTPDISEPSQDAIPARVIFRSPGTWNSSLWINIGAEINEAYENPLLMKNSPVLVGDSIVGVVDYVGKKQSRVRLITDSGLVPSVRVSRGYEQNRAIAENLPDLISFSNAHGELFDAPEEKMQLEKSLNQLYRKLLEKKPSWYLAKGEIRGQSHPLWRTDSHILKGSGFNYDFEDEYGPARDLRSGEPIGGDSKGKAMSLVKVGDLLVTTGMDGVFPPNLKVAIVTKVELLREGDYAFDLDAKPTLGNLDDLTWVYVIAPMGFDETDQPHVK